MTYYDISKKMLKRNFSKYRLYFFCNLFAAALFFCFASIFTNASFMNEEIVNSLISSNIYFPSMLAALFLIIFLPVSCQVFLASRKQEYGIMLSLGMSPREAFRNILFENIAIAVIALMMALAAGTALSVLFFAVINYGIGIKGLQWQFSVKPYKIIVCLYAVVTAVTILLNAVKLLHQKIGILLKEQYRFEPKGKLLKWLDCFAPRYMKKHLLEWSFVRRHKREWGVRYIFASLIIACIVMLASVCITLYPSFLHDAEDS